jgi:hypothetical protein
VRDGGLFFTITPPLQCPQLARRGGSVSTDQSSLCRGRRWWGGERRGAPGHGAGVVDEEDGFKGREEGVGVFWAGGCRVLDHMGFW